MKRILCLFLMVPFMTLASSLQEGLVAWYKFDGNLNDATGNGYELSGGSVAYGVDRNQELSTALSCSGSTELRPSETLEVDETFTVACWVKAGKDTAVHSEHQSGTYYDEGNVVLAPGFSQTYHDAGAGVGFSVGKNGIAVYEHAGCYLPVVLMYEANIGDGWNHVAVQVENNGAPRVYLNGVLIRTGVLGNKTKRSLVIMADGEHALCGGGYGHFSGSLDDLRIYNRALSAAEVKSLYENGGGVPEVTTYTITFNANGGSPTPPAITRTEGVAYGTLPTVTKSGYALDGWYTLASGGTKVTSETKATDNVTLYAHWTSLTISAGNVTATSVTAQQRYPWNGLVDITVTLHGVAEDLAEYYCVFAATNSATKAALPVVHVTQNGVDAGSGTTWTRKYIWDTNADVGEVKIDDVALTVDVELPYVQLWENGPYWAKCNVGATRPEEYGYYFWWGDTVGYKRNSANNGWVSVKDGSSYSFSNCPTYGKNNSQLQSDGYIDSTGNLVAKYDAATVNLGAPWRMPTDAEFSALINNCTTTWTTRNGVSGRLVTGKGAYASKSIFLPAAGFGCDSGLHDLGSNGNYWSSTPHSGSSYHAWYLYFDSSNFYRYDCDRILGQSVRPVRGFAK